MDIREAIEAAKTYVSELFSAEGGRDYTLEEVELKEHVWRVTIGFARPAPIYSNLTDFVAPMRRTFKVVEISDETSAMLSVRDRARAS